MKKRHRGHGEGHISRRADGRWEAKIDLGWRNGKRLRKSIYAHSRAQVAAKLAQALRDHGMGLPVAPERQTVGAFLKQWLDEAVKPSVRPLTHEQYCQHVRLYLVPALGHIQVARLTPDHVQAFKNRQLERRLSPRTVQLSLVTLKRALKQAERGNLVARNVARLVDAPKIRPHKAQPFNPEQSRHLLETANESKHPALYTTLLLCGLRLSEALGLGWQHIDFDARTLTIERSLARVGRKSPEGSKLIFEDCKTEQSRRVLHLSESAIRALREQRRRQAEARLAALPGRWQDLGLVFTTDRGTPLEQSNVHRDYKQLLAKAGLPNVRIHDLRHSSASLLLNLGIPLKTIQSILGHSSIKVTADIYAHMAPAMARDAADRLDRIFSQN